MHYIKKTVYLETFWTPFNTVYLRDPCSLGPCSSGPYCIGFVSFWNFRKYVFILLQIRFLKIKKSVNNNYQSKIFENFFKKWKLNIALKSSSGLGNIVKYSIVSDSVKNPHVFLYEVALSAFFINDVIFLFFSGATLKKSKIKEIYRKSSIRSRPLIQVYLY